MSAQGPEDFFVHPWNLSNFSALFGHRQLGIPRSFPSKLTRMALALQPPGALGSLFVGTLKSCIQ